MIEFKKLRIEGFGSIIEPLEFDLRGKGLTIIKGVNGVGKTTFISALYWVLYGQVLKEKSSVEPWEQVKPKDFLGSKVELEFAIDNQDFQAIRCQDYKEKVDGYKGKNRLIFSGSDKIHKKDIQNDLTDTLGYSAELFKHSLLFGQKLKRLLDEGNLKMKDLFDEAFEVGFVNQAKEARDAEYKKKATELHEVTFKLNTHRETKATTIEDIQSAKEAIAKFETDKKAEIKFLKSQLKSQKADLKKFTTTTPTYDKGFDLQNSKTELKKLRAEQNEIAYSSLAHKQTKNTWVSSQTEHARLTKKLEELKNAEPELNCPTCGSKLQGKKLETAEQSFKDDITKKEKKVEQARLRMVELNEEFMEWERLKARDTLVKEKYDKLDNLIEQHEEKLEEANLAENTLKTLNEEIKETERSIEFQKSRVLQTNLPELEKRLAKQKTILKSFIKAKKSLTKETDVLQWLIKEPLGNAGLKAFIFSTMLDQLNAYLYEYQKFIDFQVVFDINLESARKEPFAMVYWKNYLTPIEDLSGGQRQLTDVAIAFALHDLVTSTKPTNLLLMDEVFESLSPDNVEVVKEMIKAKGKQKKVYLVTHKQEFSPKRAVYLNFQLSAGRTVVS